MTVPPSRPPLPRKVWPWLVVPLLGTLIFAIFASMHGQRLVEQSPTHPRSPSPPIADPGALPATAVGFPPRRIPSKSAANPAHSVASPESAQSPPLPDPEPRQAPIPQPEKQLPIQLPGANLHGKELSNLDYRNANLANADLTSTRLRNLDLTNADLSRTHWYGAVVRDTLFRSATLRNADLRGSQFSRVDLRGADLRNANIALTTIQGVSYRTALEDSDMRGADLRGADMSAARLWGTDLRGADVRGTNFRGASTIDRSCIGFSLCPSAKWRGALYDENTRFNPGFDPAQHGMILTPQQDSAANP